MKLLKALTSQQVQKIMGMEAIKTAYRTGRGRVRVRSKAEIEEIRKGKMAIVVTEIPYQVNKAK